MPPMLRLLAAGIALVAFLAACARDDDGGAVAPAPRPTIVQPVQTPCAPPRAQASGSARRTIDAAGAARAYTLIPAPGYDGATPAPLLVVYNDVAAPDAAAPPYDALVAAAGASGIVTAVVQASGAPAAWNDLAIPAAPDDVAFTRDLIGTLTSELCIDETRIFVAGFGNGGGMALRAACDLPDLIATAGVVAATFPNCRADVPLIAFHGIDDPTVPFEGTTAAAAPGERAFLQVRRAVSEWAREVGCDGLPTISRPSPEVELATFLRCRGGDGETLLYTIVGGGHTWPGSPPTADASRGYTTQEIDAADTIIAFFAEHPPSSTSQAAR